jgi:hypothetical protein
MLLDGGKNIGRRSIFNVYCHLVTAVTDITINRLIFYTLIIEKGTFIKDIKDVSYFCLIKHSFLCFIYIIKDIS